MNVFLCAIALVMTTSVVAADVQIRIGQQPKEWIGASMIEDDGSGIIAVKNVNAKSARLLHFDSKGNVQSAVIPDMAVNHLKRLTDGTLFIGGARERGSRVIYDFRIVRLRNGRYETLWEASSLSAHGFEEGAGVDIDVSPDGKRWAMTSQKRRGYRLAIGDVGKTEPLIDYDFTLDSNSGKRPRGFVDDAFDVEFVSTDSPTVAVLRSGKVWVFSGKQESPLLLTPFQGGSSLSFDPQTNKLWVNTTAILSAFDGSALGAATDITRGVQPSSIVQFDSKARQIFALTNGDVILVKRVGDGSEVVFVHGADATTAVEDKHRFIASSPLHGSVAVSPSGSAVLLMPKGPASDAVTVHKPDLHKLRSR